MPEQPFVQKKFEEKLLAQAAQSRLTEELDESEKIDVDIQTDIGKIIQGKVDGVAIAGQGLVIKEKIRVQEIKLQTDSIAVNPFSAIFGQIKLNEPVNAIAHVVMEETDINLALTSEIIRSLVQKFQLDVDGKVVKFEPQEMQVFLPADETLEFQGKIWLKEQGNSHILGYHAIAHPRTQTKPAMLESFRCTQGEGIRIELITAAMQKVKEILNLPYFEWEDMIFYIRDMQVKKGQLILMLAAHVKQLPSEETLQNLN
ncbi:DUF2993 domain-containing protein [Sphaerospermopsis kisseleviana CS-549]|uniref:DUF2993 domain-containing protein n=1 Tax=Sphaerospermopsis kisseleviana CS-549 TaxID=3021783 RepID=A0ABT4ZYM4_9CYAN|nr:DUF2993 domain-containing protein [Sphaerospermopsis kisseleviana]MDB9444135.1 DUF2993 domain-containing protein [Sphaerospermopsis kisseleviana CS-549]BAZ82806.1 hypothetical protein NIES73_40890 [Sphaerospermopsis kisseleviana NIES-73]